MNYGVGVVALGLAIFGSSVDASAAPRTHAVASHAGHTRGEKAEPAQSIGPPNAGRLEGAVRLKGSHTLHQREGAHSWGLPALVKLLHRSADRVARKHKGSVLFVGDLSGRTGGYLPGHNSHQSGRDVDVGFYVMSSKGRPVNAKSFIAFSGDGSARNVDWAHFDDVRNWHLVEALLEDKDVSVHYIFVSNELKARLLQTGAKKHATKELLTRASAAMMSPENADLHDDHFHVRIACPLAMHNTCVEQSGPHTFTKDPHIGAAAAAAGFEPAVPGAHVAPAPEKHAAEPAEPGAIDPTRPSDPPSPPPIGD